MFQIVDVNDLTSTNVNGVGVVYAHVVTSQPQFGVKEWNTQLKIYLQTKETLNSNFQIKHDKSK